MPIAGAGGFGEDLNVRVSVVEGLPMRLARSVRQFGLVLALLAGGLAWDLGAWGGCWGLVCACAPGPFHGGGGHEGGGHPMGHGPMGYGYGLGVGGFVPPLMPMFVGVPLILPVAMPMPPLGVIPVRGGMMNAPNLPPPPPGFAPVARMARRPLPRRDPERAARLTVIGDRLFRAGNLKHAFERYQQAVQADPDSASPRARLAQVALARGHYRAAADRLREAELAEPGWIPKAADIQALYREPTDFARDLARLETHLQVHPEDRDGWLVLGAEWFLSGRTTKAAQVFRRLEDPNHRSDVALQAFLDASRQTPPQPHIEE
jgi:tetratricopeptide (TPR) repeat protein